MATQNCEKCGNPFDQVGVANLCVQCYVTQEMSWIFE